MLSSSQKVALIERERQLVSELRDWQEQWKDERKTRAKLQSRTFIHLLNLLLVVSYVEQSPAQSYEITVRFG